MRRVWLRQQTGMGVSPVTGLPASGAGPGRLGGPRYISLCGLCMAPRNPRVRLGFVRAEGGREGASRRGEGAGSDSELVGSPRAVHVFQAWVLGF